MFRDIGDEEERVARELIDDRLRGFIDVHELAREEIRQAVLDDLLGSVDGRMRLARWRAG